MSKLTVWINQDKCTGSGLCLEECPSMFVHNEKGKGRIKKDDGSLVEVAPEHHKTVIAAFDACPTSAIGIERG